MHSMFKIVLLFLKQHFNTLELNYNTLITLFQAFKGHKKSVRKIMKYLTDAKTN